MRRTPGRRPWSWPEPYSFGAGCAPTEPSLLVANRTVVPVVFGFAPAVPACATAVYSWSELTTTNDAPVPPGAWMSPIQINVPPGTDLISAIVTDAGVDVREGRVADGDLPPCRGVPPQE